MPLPDPSPRRSARPAPAGPGQASRPRRTALALSLGLGLVAACWGPASATAGDAPAAGPGNVPVTVPATSQPAPQGLMLALQIDRDGQRLATPTLWVQPGHPAEITVHEQLRLAVVPQLDGDRADLRLALHTWHDGAMALQASPRLVTRLGQAATLSMTDEHGRTLRVQVLATLTPRPGR